MSNLTFIDAYVDRASEALGALVGRPLTTAEKSRIQSVAASELKDAPAVIANPYRGFRIDTTVAKAATWMLTRQPMQPIVTGHGTLFKPHGEFRSVIGEMVAHLMGSRKVVKNRMFDLLREGRSPEDPEVKALDQQQKIWKLLANSFYGAYGEKGFHFYDPALGPAVTFTGQLIISTTLYGFEAFLGGNLWLRTPGELARHVAACLMMADGDSPETDWGEHPDRDAVSEETAVQSLLSACAPGWDAEEYARSLVAGRTDGELWSIILRGDPYSFMNFPKATELLAIAVTGGEIREADPGKLAKHHPEGKAALEALFAGLKRWCAAVVLPGDLPNLVTEIQRRVVILTDTDSTFLNLGPWMSFVTECFGLQEASEDARLTAMNAMVYLLRLLSDTEMGWLMKNLSVPEEKRSLINFKSEFVIPRMVLTNGKKNYASLVRFQEGARIVGDKVELKGLAMKKTTVAKSTGKFFESSIEDRVLRPTVVDRKGTLRDVVVLEERIRQSIQNGGTEYSQPLVLGRISEYSDQYAMPVVRGSTAWNLVYPDNPIREGDRVNAFKIRVGTDASLLAEELQQWPDGSEEAVALETIAGIFFDATDTVGFAKNGFNWLCVPKDVKQLPAWAVRLVDVDSVVQANVAPIFPILESLGIKMLRLPQPETYSNSVSF